MEFQCEFAPGPVKVSIAFPGAGSWAIAMPGPSHRLAAIPPLAAPKIFSKSRRGRNRSIAFIGHTPICELLARSMSGVNSDLIKLPGSRTHWGQAHQPYK